MHMYWYIWCVYCSQTRIADWEEGGLENKFLLLKLRQASEDLQSYEIEAAPKGWRFLWDRYRHIYVHTQLKLYIMSMYVCCTVCTVYTWWCAMCVVLCFLTLKKTCGVFVLLDDLVHSQFE